MSIPQTILDNMNEHIKDEKEEKQSNLRFKLDSMPKFASEVFFERVTKNVILDALRDVKTIDDTKSVITFSYTLPLISINEWQHEDDFDYALNHMECHVLDFNYHECIDLLELMMNITSGDDDIGPAFESTYSTI